MPDTKPEWRRSEYTLSFDTGRLDVGAIHAYLSLSYWAEGIPIEVVRRSIPASLCVGVYHESDGQVAFARVITDRATFAYLCDVYVLEAHRERGLAKWMMEAIVAHPDLQGLRRFMLVTRDAHELYRPFGFTEPANPNRYMEIARPGIYLKNAQSE